MKLFFRGTINEGWKNWMLAIVLAVMSLGHIQQANAQNVVVDEIIKTKYDTLTLDPNISIEENHHKIDNFIRLREESNYTKKFIVVRGHYVGNHNNSYDFPIGRIHVKDKYYVTLTSFFPYGLPHSIRDDVGYVSVREEIINVLTKLYSHSLDTKFPQVKSKEYDSVKTDNGYFYSLNSKSPLYEKIHNKVVRKF